MLKDVVVSSPKHVCFKNCCRICLLSPLRFFGVVDRVTPSKTTIILRSSSKFTPSALFPSLSWPSVDFSSNKNWLVVGFHPIGNLRWKLQKSLKPPPHATICGCAYWTFSHNLCVVWFFCASPTLLLLYWWLQSFVSIIQPEILNGTRTSGTSKIHNFHLDIAKYTKGSNAMFKSYLYLIFSWFIYKYINTSTINYAGNIRSLHQIHMGVSQNRGVSPKMDGVLIMEKTLLKWMIWGKIPTIFGNIHIVFYAFSICFPFSCFTWSLDFKGAEKVRRSGNRDLWSWSVSSD